MSVFQVIQRNIREEQPLVGSGNSTSEYVGYSLTKNHYQLTTVGAVVGTLTMFYTVDGLEYTAIKDADGLDFSFDLAAKETIILDASIKGLKAVGSGVTGLWEVLVISSVI